ncbi:MAG: hypothetical protein KIT31_03290 [Deltaproteobacteria bacterium]|nr:hypothetical protein [Deltaproteobacteria bacterium]
MKGRRLALNVLLASVAVGAILAIVAILGGPLDELTAKILATTLTISLSSLFALAAFAGWEAPGARLYARAGVASSLAFTVMLVNAIWRNPTGDRYGELTLSFLLIAFTCGQGSLLALAKLAPAHRWVRNAANTASILVCAALLATLWGHALGQAIAVLSVLDVAFTVATVVCHVLGRAVPAAAGAVAEVLYCIHCGRRLWLPAGEVRCHHCEKRFFVELRPDGDLPDAIVRDPS